MKLWSDLSPRLKWTVIGAGALVVVAIVAVAMGLGSSDSKSERSSKQVSAEEFAQVQKGWTKSRLEELAGKPQSTDSTIAGGLRTECWYYGGGSDDTSQFCFQNGRLSVKSRY